MSEFWRWIDTGPLSGPENMAIDESLLNNLKPGRPVFRVYGWEPEALSIGRFQNARKALDLDACSRENIPVVRRITGGGIIHHHDELTYSLVCTQEDIASGASVKESFRILCGFLLSFYDKLGLKAEFALTAIPQSRLGVPSAFCFAGKEEYDILVDGKKIGGNAQRRFKNIIFQHGSIPIRLDRNRSSNFLCEKPADLNHSTTCLEELGVMDGFKSLSTVLKTSVLEHFKTGISEQELTAEESAAARSLLVNKYSTDKWNLDEIGDTVEKRFSAALA